MSNQGRVHVIWGVIVLILLIAIGYFIFNKPNSQPIVSNEQNAVVNTETNTVTETIPPIPTPTKVIPGPMPKMTYKIINNYCANSKNPALISLIADGNEVTVLESPYCDIEKVIFRTGNSDVVYFSVEPNGLGGYIIYHSAFNLYKLDLKTKTSDLIMNHVASLDFDSGLTKAILVNTKVIVKDLTTNTDESFGALPGAANGQVGNIKFSPDLQKAAIAIGYGPGKEYGEIYVLDLSTKKFSLYKSLASGHLQVNGWKNNDEVDWSIIQ